MGTGEEHDHSVRERLYMYVHIIRMVGVHAEFAGAQSVRKQKHGVRDDF
jgi:hypothetical protein